MLVCCTQVPYTQQEEGAPFNVHVGQRPDAVPLLRDGLHRALDGGRAARQILVILLYTFNLKKKAKST